MSAASTLRRTVGIAAVVALALSLSAPARADDSAVRGVVTADGQRQWISCAGTGTPTVVLAAGLGASHTAWSIVVPRLRERTRVCVYDRPGLGASPARRGSKTTDAGEHADELRALLAKAGEQGPFVLVGHSYAGLIVRSFAAQAPREVAGVLLLDAVYPGIQRTFLASYRGPWHEGGTVIDMDASERATQGGPDLGDTPLMVITAGRPGNGSTWADRTWNREQTRSATLSTNAQHWFARKSGHVVQREQPAIVVRGVEWLLAQAR